jgi:hypothetical protein
MMIEEMSMGTSSETVQLSTPLYRRELPGAGYVAIDMTRMDDDATGDQTDGTGSRVRLYVERRAEEERRTGHQPPVVAEFTGSARAPEVGELYRMAADNAALARALIEWQGRRQRKTRDD